MFKPLSPSTDYADYQATDEAQTTDTKANTVALESVFHQERISMLDLFLRLNAEKKKNAMQFNQLIHYGLCREYECAKTEI